MELLLGCRMALIVIGTAQIVAARGTNQLAMMPAECLAAVRANLLRMVRGPLRLDGASKITINFTRKIGMQGSWKLRKHGREISMVMGAVSGICRSQAVIFQQEA